MLATIRIKIILCMDILWKDSKETVTTGCLHRETLKGLEITGRLFFLIQKEKRNMYTS